MQLAIGGQHETGFEEECGSPGKLLAPTNTVEEDRVLGAKRESKSFRALLRFFRKG